MSERPPHLAECWIELSRGTWRQARYDARELSFVVGPTLKVPANSIANWVPADFLAQRQPELRAR